MKVAVRILILVVLLFMLAIFGAYAFGMRLYRIDPRMHSMEPTIAAGSLLVVHKDFRRLENGDLVLLQNWTLPDAPILAKRIVALGGQRLKIEGPRIFLNGVIIEEPYVNLLNPRAASGFNSNHQTDTLSEFTVRDGRYFVMGDNRSVSFDSRDSAFGLIHQDWIIGRIVTIW